VINEPEIANKSRGFASAVLIHPQLGAAGTDIHLGLVQRVLNLSRQAVEISKEILFRVAWNVVRVTPINPAKGGSAYGGSALAVVAATRAKPNQLWPAPAHHSSSLGWGPRLESALDDVCAQASENTREFTPGQIEKKSYISSLIAGGEGGIRTLGALAEF
jgi:hypothetical protein